MDPERVARNEATFREANEIIERAAEKAGATGPVPFICECAEQGCRDVIRLTLEEYEQVRTNAAWFAVAHGHEHAAGDYGEVVERNAEFVLVAKTDEAASVAEELDPRAPQGC